jgi:hypothetical protein
MRADQMSSGRFLLRPVAVALVLLLGSAINARADGVGLFTIQEPGRLSLTMFGSGFGADTYSTTQVGFQLEQSITHYVAAVGRVTAYQVYQGEGYNSPFVTEVVGTRTFERFQGGIDITPVEGVSLVVLGGHDVGNADRAVIEGDFSSWLFLHSRHPVDFSFTSTHYYENGITSSLIDLRTIVYSTGKWLFLAGGGGAFWGGGPEGKPDGQGGPDLGIFFREWDFRIDLQSGYGSSHLYGLVSFSKTLGWDE